MITINAICVAAYIVSGLYILHRYKKVFVFYVLYFVFQAYALLSCFYNDLGIYNPELFRYTEVSLATARLALFYLLFNAGFALVARLIHDRPMARKDYALLGRPIRLGNLKVIAYGLVALLICYYTYRFWTDGIPALQGIDRRTFSQQSGMLGALLTVYGPLLAFLLGYHRKMRGWLSVNGIILALFVIFKLMTSHKFSGLVDIVVPYYAAVYVRYLSRHPHVSLLRARNLVYSAVCAVAFLGLAFVTYYSAVGNETRAWRILTDRALANQGQLWWAVDNDYFGSGTYDHNHWLTEARAVLSPGSVAEESVGMKYLMVNILGPEKAYLIFEYGYLYTMAYPAILVMAFPYPVAMAIQFAAGIVFFLMLYYLYYSILYRHLFRSILMLLVVLPFKIVMATGLFVVFATAGVVIKIGLILLAEMGLLRTRAAGART